MKNLLLVILAFLIVESLNSQCNCPELFIKNNVQINVTNVSQLDSALDEANNLNGNVTILLSPGVYALSSNLRFISANMINLTIQGQTGNRDDVVIKGLGWDNNDVTHIFNVAADNFTLAHVTIGEVYYHPIQVHSNPNDADSFLVQNVRFIDAAEQLLKVSGGGDLFADNGRVLCCAFEFTAGIAYQWYTGGIDAHRSKDWYVAHNTFANIRSPESNLAEHAIHFWRESNGTVVEANYIINCDRGIGFGLGSDPSSGHDGGLIVNNFVHTTRDVGIGLESATNAKIYNNTVITENYSNSIEYRFNTTTNAHIVNNLVDGNITDRSSGSDGSLTTNFTVSDYSIFLDANNHDYHLANSVANISDAGTLLDEVIYDYDCDVRGGSVDIGADDLSTTTSDALLESASIILFPNPTSGRFSITGNFVNYQIQILDSQGMVHQTLNQSNGIIDIDLSALPAGLYFVKMEHKDNGILNLRQILKM